jgi:hypothetical protein
LNGNKLFKLVDQVATTATAEAAAVLSVGITAISSAFESCGCGSISVIWINRTLQPPKEDPGTENKTAKIVLAYAGGL